MALPVASTSFVKLEGQSKFIDGTGSKAFNILKNEEFMHVGQ